MRKKLLLTGSVVALAAIMMTGCGEKEPVNQESSSADSGAVMEYVQPVEEVVENFNDTPVTGRVGETLDYYYNIDTTQFDKSKFDGNIFFYGEVINGKITSKKITDAGFEIEEAEDVTMDEVDQAEYGFNYRINITLLKDGAEAESDPLGPHLVSYTENDAIDSEDALFVTYNQRFAWFTETFEVFPSVLGVSNSSEINIDLVLEKLGNPTYVYGRTTPYITDISFLSYTTYVYVYDDVAFLYAFDNADNLNLVSVEYYPIEQLLEPETNGLTPMDVLNNEYSIYSM